MSRQLVTVVVACLAVAAVFSVPLFPMEPDQEVLEELDTEFTLVSGNEFPVNNTPAACNSTTFQPCLQMFFNNFGYNGSFPPSMHDFNMRFFRMINQTGVGGWATLQGWMNTLYNCTGPHAVHRCIHWQNMMTMYNISMYDAQGYDVRIKSLEYETGHAYHALTHHWYCIQGTFQHLRPVIQQCNATLQSQNAANPGQFCQHLVQYLYCIERPYSQNCGHAAGKLVCHLEKISYNIYAPQCANNVALSCANPPEKEFEEVKEDWE